MAVHKCCTFRFKRKNLLSPTPDACCPLFALRNIQLMTGELRSRYSSFQLLGESGPMYVSTTLRSTPRLSGWPLRKRSALTLVKVCQRAFFAFFTMPGSYLFNMFVLFCNVPVEISYMREFAFLVRRKLRKVPRHDSIGSSSRHQTITWTNADQGF